MIEKIAMERFDDIKALAERHSSFSGGLGYARLSFGGSAERYERLMSSVLHFDGMTMMLCTRGALNVEVNLETYTIGTDTMLLLGPRSIVRHSPDSSVGDCEIEVLFITTSFMHTINIDLNSINTRLIPSRTPLLTLQRDESRQLVKTLDLLHDHMSVNDLHDHYFNFISRSLMAVMLYQLMQFGERRMSESDDGKRPKSRRVNYVQNFISLVSVHYRAERSVGFYAGKLCISPKYLSMIIKDATGHSASEIIDEFVITEAKNLLRYSGKNIQQIAYELNFSNQSSFGKYFKHATGMSPTKFQSR